MNKDNQLYQLIPEPAGDWQEGDKSTVHTEGYRLRPVPAQACACEGLREWLDSEANKLRSKMNRMDASNRSEFDKLDAELWGLIRVGQYLHTLAQSCQHSVSHSVQQPDLSGGVEAKDTLTHITADEVRHATSETTDLPVAGSGAQRASERLVKSGQLSGSSAPPAQNISDGGGGASHTDQCNRQPETAHPAPSSLPPAAASEAQVSESDLLRAASECSFEAGFAAGKATIREKAERLASIIGKTGVKPDYLPTWCDEQEATVAALRRELEEQNKTIRIWQSNAAEAGRSCRILAVTRKQAEDDRDKWKERAEKVEQKIRDIDDLYRALPKPIHPEVWHDYAHRPPKEEDGVDVLCHGQWEILCLYPNGDIRIKATQYRSPESGCKWARITLPPVPAEPVQDKDEAVEIACPFCKGETEVEYGSTGTTISCIGDCHWAVNAPCFPTEAQEFLRHARTTEERKP